MIDDNELLKVAKQLNFVFGEPCNYDDYNDNKLFFDEEWCNDSACHCNRSELCWLKFMKDILEED